MMRVALLLLLFFNFSNGNAQAPEKKSTFPFGTYKWLGIACPPGEKLNELGILMARKVTSGDAETFITIEKDRLSVSAKLYSYSGYGDDNCLTKMQSTFKLDGTNFKSDFISHVQSEEGPNGAIACRKKASKKSFSGTWLYDDKAKYLYLSMKESEGVPINYCTKSAGFLVYKNEAVVIFLKQKRPLETAMEIANLKLINANPKLEKPYVQHIKYLLFEQRSEDAIKIIKNWKAQIPSSEIIPLVESAIALVAADSQPFEKKTIQIRNAFEIIEKKIKAPPVKSK